MRHGSLVVLLLCLVAVLRPSYLCAPLSTTATVGNVTASARRSVSTTAVSGVPLFHIFGYLPEYRQHSFDYETFFQSGLTHLIFFSAEVDPATLRLTHVDDRLPSGGEWARVRRLADLHGTKLMLCIGGSGRSSGFAHLVGDTVRRRAFIEDVKAVLLARSLDGIDFNWEYPQTMTQWRDFGRFLGELRSVLSDVKPAGGEGTSAPTGERRLRTRGRPAVLSMALHPHSFISTVLQSAGVLQSLDFVHWMAYDHVVGVEPHSSVEYAASVLSEEMIGIFRDDTYNVHRGSTYQRQGAEQSRPCKLTLGIPFYGRHRVDRRLQPETYQQLWLSIRQWANEKHPTWVEGGAELRALSEHDGYSFTSYDDVQRKMRLARAANLSGIMIWELGQDVPPGTSPMSLMTAVHEQLVDWGLVTDGSVGRGGDVNSDDAGVILQPPVYQKEPQYPSAEMAEEGDL